MSKLGKIVSNKINIATKKDYEKYISTSSYYIPVPMDHPELEIITSSNYPDGKCKYPFLHSKENLHKRNNNKWYLNFTNEIYTGVIGSHAEGYVSDYYLDGSFVFRTHYRWFEQGKSLYERITTRNGDLFQDFPGIIECDNPNIFDLDWEWPDSIPQREIEKSLGIYNIDHTYYEMSDTSFDSRTMKFYENGVLKEEIIHEHYPTDAVSIIFYYPEGPKKEKHTYIQQGQLVSKTYFDKCYYYHTDRDCPDGSTYLTQKFDPDDGTLLEEIYGYGSDLF